jgi:monothiol glutaredoxin
MSEQTNPIREAIAEAISDNDVILFMKGTPDGPACGFSARAVAALQSVGTPFAAVDILPDPRIRQELSALSGWPTIPQLFVGGELLGGSDIIVEMYASGELADAVGAEPATGTEKTAPLEPQAAQPAPLGIENRLG